MIVVPVVTPVGWQSAVLAWFGQAGATVRVFLNGFLTFGPTVMSDAGKSVTVSLPDPCIIEVHESDAGETVPSVSISLMRKPLVWWSSREDALEYRIYSGSILLGVVRHDPSRSHHEYQVPTDLRQDGGTWTDLRVEDVSADGQESVRDPFPIFAPGVPAEPADLTIAGGSGVFDFTVVP